MRILAIRFSGLGDIVMLLSTFEKLKDRYKGSSITLLCDRSNASLDSLACGLIDEVVGVDRGLFRAKSLKAIGEVWRLYRFLKRKRFDMVIDFQNFGETALMTYLANAPIKRGAPKKQKYHYAYNHIVPRDERGHRSQFFHRIAGVDDSLHYPRLCLDEEAKAYKEKLLGQLDPSKPILGLNIGSTQESRRWSEKKFLEVARHFKNSHNVMVFIGPLEQKFVPLFEEFLVVKDTSLSQLAGALSCCDRLLSNDTGPAHMAAALGVEVITLFSTGTDENVGVLSDRKHFLRRNPIDSIALKEVISILQKPSLS
jgi:ADP-heptose:LPS heptosyltransferase